MCEWFCKHHLRFHAMALGKMSELFCPHTFTGCYLMWGKPRCDCQVAMCMLCRPCLIPHAWKAFLSSGSPTGHWALITCGECLRLHVCPPLASRRERKRLLLLWMLRPWRRRWQCDPKLMELQFLDRVHFLRMRLATANLHERLGPNPDNRRQWQPLRGLQHTGAVVCCCYFRFTAKALTTEVECTGGLSCCANGH